MSLCPIGLNYFQGMYMLHDGILQLLLTSGVSIAKLGLCNCVGWSQGGINHSIVCMNFRIPMHNNVNVGTWYDFVVLFVVILSRV